MVVNFKDFGSADELSRTFPNWLYVGRANGQLPKSPLANPFKLNRQKRNRKEVIDKYRRWLWRKIQAGDHEIIGLLDQIGPKTVLVCWCAPEACHADVVHKAAAWLRQEKAKTKTKGPRKSGPLSF